MKIAIITLPLHNNYGGILQCYALQTVLERMGHKVFVPVLSSDITWNLRFRLCITRFIKTYLLRTESKYYGCKTENEIIRQYTQPYIDKYIHSKRIHSWNDLQEIDFDAFVVGSDQVWRPRYFQPIANAYLDFAKDWKDIKRIAYAASFGTDEWEYTPEETAVCTTLLKKFDAVSVRELSAIDLCKTHFYVDAVQLIDPTLSLSPQDYLVTIDKSNLLEHKNGLLCYFLDEEDEKFQLANKLAQEKGLTPFLVYNSRKKVGDEYFENGIQLPIDQWIAGFQDAQFVVTDSFHGCVFSILFNKPFIAIGNEERGMARFHSLLKIFHLENRLVMVGDTQAFLERSSIPWEEINCTLEKERKRAFEFLNQNLANTKKLFY